MPPLVCHLFSKVDRFNAGQKNIETLKNLKDKELVDSYLFVSAKTSQGVGDLRETIYDLMTPKVYIKEHPVDARVEEYR